MIEAFATGGQIMPTSANISACSRREKINGDSFLDTLRDLAPHHTLRETLDILATEDGMIFTYAALNRTAQRHHIHFQPAAKGGKRDGSGRPQGSTSVNRPHGCSWVAGDYGSGGLAGDDGSPPPEPFQATKRTGLALLDTSWILRTGSYLGPCQGLPDGAPRAARSSRRQADRITRSQSYSGVNRQ